MNARPMIIALISAATALGAAAPASSASLEAAAQAAVEPPAPDPDLSTQEKVKAALMADPALRGARIAISTRDGHVTLAGVVMSEDQRHRAQQLVAAVDGVRKVDNALEIQPGQ